MTDLHQRLARLTPQQRAALEARLLAAPGTAAATIPRRASGVDAPLSYAQERLWFLQRFDPGDTAYHLHLVERLHGPVDAGLLQRALDTVVARHEVLRSGLPIRGGRPVQVPEPGRTVPVTVVAVDGATATDREAHARALVDELVNAPFDLERAPLLRVALLRLDDDDHVFCLVLHHVAGDGWSLAVIADELSRDYPALLAGTVPDLPDLPVQYADYAAWQRARSGDAEQTGRIERLRERVGAAPPLVLPTDGPRPSVRTAKGRSASRRLGPLLSARVTELAKAEKATVFMTLLAAYQVLLARHSGQRDFCIGSPMAGRDRPEVRPLVGCLTDTLLLRADLAGDPTFRQLLARVRDDALRAYAEQGVALEQLIEQVGADRDTSRTPLFQAMFNLQPARTGLLALPGVTATPWAPDLRHVKVDVELDVNQYPDDLELQLSVSEVFDPGTARRLTGHLATLLASAVTAPDRPLSRLTMLDDAERHLVLRECNDTVAAYPQRTLHELVAGQAARTPDAVAVLDAGRQLTYRELDGRANGLAWWLRERGLRPHTPVAVLLPRDADLVVALLAVLRAGCHYVPLEPGYPTHRLREIVADAGVPVVLTRGASPWPDVTTIDLDDEQSGPADEAPSASGDPDDLAYLIYTSGSTGRPKGIRVPHRGVVNLVTDVARTLGCGPADRWLFLTSVSFDIAALEVFAPLLTGGAVVVAGASSVYAVDQVRALIADHAVTTVQAPPSVLEALLPQLPPGLPRVISGGEALPARLAERLLDRVGELWNFYGPTETTIWSTRSRVRPGEPVSIGSPVANTAAYVLDERYEPTPVGCVGELYLAGAGVARDYHADPALTADRFLPDPYGAAPGGRMYRTGDLVRRRADGQLDFVGRTDDQVKLGGVRIEPGDIEAALADHPQVRRAVVTVRDDQPAGRALVGYVDWAGDDDPATALRAHLRTRLPEAMIPAAFVVPDAFPVLPSGKLDRAALPAPVTVPAAAPSRPPQTDSELLVAEVFGEVLGRDRLGADDDFFALGGNSLLAIRALAELGATTELDIPLRTLFTHRTVGQLATVIEELIAADLDQLSDQEAARLLADRGRPT
ncbi:amino acid adenylation domain-containing protein [Micromonospora sp. CPCC 206060]|uniref:non-ribosomal peptide synthetase n=1 Tax=Micromonospora sp. CPCC 206060 TaxID=3122406 RepID=UPI002FF0E214